MPFVPPQLGELENAREPPVLLGAFLARLALTAIGHDLTDAVRRRRLENSVLRGSAVTSILARVTELESINSFLDAIAAAPAVLVIEGAAGIGKTTLWRAALKAAGARGVTVLAASPTESETKLSFAALADLLASVDDEELEALPPPQRRALAAAILREEPIDLDHRAVAAGFLSVVATLSARAPVLIAVDDSQWLDRPSAAVLDFATRRMRSARVGVLTAVRVPNALRMPLGPDRALEHHNLQRLALSPLPKRAVESLLRREFGQSLDLTTAARVAEASGGNPFVALELARAVLRDAAPRAPGQPLPVPDSLLELAAARTVDLPAEAHDALVVAAALSIPTPELVRSVLGSKGDAGLTSAEEAGVINIDHGRIRFTHPLLASAVYARTAPRKRRQLHRQLATLVCDAEERARHLALGAEGPDEAVAAALEEGGRRAWLRGAPASAAELFEHAMLLTAPGDVVALRRRQVETAEYRFAAGDVSGARSLLQEAVAAVPAGRDRADAFWRLGKVRRYESDYRAAAWDFARALEDVGADTALRAAIERDLALASVSCGDVAAAAPHAAAAVELAEAVGDRVLLDEVVAARALVDFFLGRGLDPGALQRMGPSSARGSHLPLDLHPDVLVAGLLRWADDFDAARPLFEDAYRRAEERGAEAELPFLLWQMSEMECWAGNWNLANQYAERGHEAATLSGSSSGLAGALAMRALVRACLGRADDARGDAEEGLSLASTAGVTVHVVSSLQALGFLELSLGNAAAAHARLGTVSQLVMASGLQDPAPAHYFPDEIEALVCIGELDSAQALLEWFEERGRGVNRTWALATGARCRALVQAGRGNLNGAVEALDEALAHHERLPMPFELARSLLVGGQLHRRRKERRAAQELVERALYSFEKLGAPLWAERARAELDRVYPSRRGAGGLTATEERVAQLAASGFTNRQVAETLFVSPKTVEATLARVYRKLGIRTRAELGRRIPEPSSGPVQVPEL